MYLKSFNINNDIIYDTFIFIVKGSTIVYVDIISYKTFVEKIDSIIF